MALCLAITKKIAIFVKLNGTILKGIYNVKMYKLKMSILEI